MTFSKLVPTQYPCRQWALVGYPGSGKSTLAVQMAGPMVVIDADHRFAEVVGDAREEVYELSANPADHVDPQRIAQLLKTNMPGAVVKTVVVDSLTAIIAPLVTQAIMSNDSGANKNRVATFKDKALAMRLLQDVITNWGTDTLWIYHLRQGLDGQARQVEHTSITQVELVRLRRSLNMQLRVIEEGGKRGIVVDWARRGRYPLTLWDETGGWVGMPERIEEAVYGGLTKKEMDGLEKGVPSKFHSPDEAIAWGFEQGVFKDAVHAKHAYEKLKADKIPKSALEMGVAWTNHVQERVRVSNAPTDEEYDHYQEVVSGLVNPELDSSVRG